MSYFNEPEDPSCCEQCGYAMQDCIEGCANCSLNCRRGVALCLINCCSYGTPAPLDSGSEVLPPWRKLWVEFVNRVTWHGLKYTELRSRFIIRRFIWTIILLITVSLFLYINSTKLMYLLTYPVTINLNVLYNNSLPFPAITICNPNHFRLTALHEMGLLDLMVNDFESPNCKSCAEYVLYTEVCWAKKVDSKEFFSYTFTEVSRRVCMSLCSETYNTKCSGFFYYRMNRTCLLSSYTGEWIGAEDPPCPPHNGTEFYRRIRKIGHDSITCTFEESSCLFENEVDTSDSWSFVEAKKTPVSKDNTLNLGSGHIVSLLATEQKPGYKAELSSPYLNTTDMCLELFYWFQADKANLGEIPSLTVLVVDEEKVRNVVNMTNKFIQDWTRFFVRLPAGINQIVIEGTRAKAGTNGIALDDINVRKCTQFSLYRNCKVSRKGIAYMGSLNVSTSGEACLMWEHIKSPLVYKLPDQFAKDAVNYCRYIPQENWEEPSCFVRSSDSVAIAPCSVPFCSCQNNSSFTCDNGLCLPSNLLCNGIQDCIDGSDEAEACVDLMRLDCTFDEDFACGYTRNKVGSLSWERKSSSELIRYTSTSIYQNVSTLAHMMFLDSTYGQVGDQVQLLSPVVNFSTPTLVSFDYIMTSTSDLTDNGVSGLYLYQYSVLRTPVQLLFKKTNFNDTEFVTSEVCTPPGRYHLMFLGVQGRLYEQAIALPAVRILGDCTNPAGPQSGNPVESSLNCFFATMCGYNFLSSTAYLNFSFDYTKDIMSTFNNGPACYNTFNGVDGTILSPGYPSKYPDNMQCTFEILEPQGATISVNFLEFSLEAESDCLYDRLEVYDPVTNITRFFCGNTIPPPITSRGNRLRFSFMSDGSENVGKFKINYLASTLTATDFSLVFKYTGPSLLHGYNHFARLMSPMVSIQGKSCLVAEVIILSSFKVLAAHEKVDTAGYTETTIFSTPRSLGKEWHKLFIDLDPSHFKEGRFVAVFEVKVDYTSALKPAAIKKVSLAGGTCRDSVTNPSLACNFADIDQCGYFDSSTGSVHWTRIFNENSKLFFMSAFYKKEDKDPAVLRSARISIDSQKCISIYYDTSESIFEMEISSTLFTSGTSRYQLITDDSASIRYNIQKGAQEISFKVYPSSSGEYVRSKDSEVNIQRIVMLDGACPTSEKQSDLDCDFDNLFICNFKASSAFGAAWLWLPYDSVVSYGEGSNASTSRKPHVIRPVDYGSVMIYNQSSDNFLGVLTSPAILLNSTATVRFEALGSSKNLTSLQVFYGSSMGQVTGKLFEAKFDDDLTWKNFSICLPARNLYLFFVASVARSQFVLVDNVATTSNSCKSEISEPNHVCNSDGTSLDCPSTLFSWSSSFEWINTSAIQNNFNPDLDGCMYVYDRSKGSFHFRPTGKNEANKTECDIYIRGKGRMIVTLTFSQFESKECVSQYVEVWENQGIGPPSLSKILCKLDMNSTFNFTVDNLIQLRVLSTKGYPRFVLKFSYSISSPSAYSSGLYYTPGLAASQLGGIATWASPIRVPENNTVCLRFDVALPLSSLDIQAIYQFDGSNMRTMTVYSATRFKAHQRDWSNGTLQITFDPPPSNRQSRLTVQFLFVFSLDLEVATNSSHIGSMLIAAINNVRLSESECSTLDISVSPSPPICLLDSKDFCGFHDESGGSSRWARVSLRSDHARSRDCRSKEDGSTYTGLISSTISGRSCQRWDSQTPQKHNQDVSEYFPDDSILSAANRCRNPNNPFIPRSCWCYTTDVKQRREYCDIPLCLDKYFQVEFSASMSSATLASSAFSITTSYCFAFQYIISSPFIQLEVHSLDDKGNSNLLEVFSLRDHYVNPIESDLTMSEAPVGYVTLNPVVKKIKFVAKKLDNQIQLRVLITNMTSYGGSCSSVMPARIMAINKVPYRGPIRNRTYFKKQIFEDLKDWNILNLTEVLSHQKEDLVHKCSYDSAECSQADVATVQTDIGQCYTFNKNALRTSSTSGLEYGAKFILNIEQYEHVAGYTAGEGVKLQLHDHSDIPSMKDLSVAALPGVHNLGIVSYARYENLEPPYGKCGMFPLDYYDLYEDEPYSEARCKLERKTKKAERECRCRQAYMPGFSRFCDLNESLSCLNRIVSRTLATQCPTPCLFDSYSIQISQIGLSGLGMSDLLDNRSSEVEGKYLTALNLRHRVGKDMTNLLQLLEYFLSRLNEFEDNVYFSILDSHTSALYHVESAIKTLIELSTTDITRTGRGLINDVEQNFKRFDPSRLDYLEEYLKDCHFRLAYFRDLSYEVNSKEERAATSRDWHLLAVNQTLNSMSALNEVLATYEFITSSDASVDCVELTDLSLLDACKCNVQSLFKKIEPMTVLMKQVLDAIGKSSDVPSAWTDIVPESSLSGLLDITSRTMRCSVQLQAATNNLKKWLDPENLPAANLRNASQSVNPQSTLIVINSVRQWLEGLKRNYSLSIISKRQLAERLSGSEVDRALRNISNIVLDITQNVLSPIQDNIFISENLIRTYYQTFLLHCQSLYNITRDAGIENVARSLIIWRKPLANLELPEEITFTLKSEETWQVWPKEQTLSDFYPERSKIRLNFILDVYFDSLKKEVQEFTSQLNGFHDNVKGSMTSLEEKLANYLRSTELNEDFLRSNFLMLDIYYSDMKYNDVVMESAYGWIDFFSNVGGYFGLLMGCSVITMCEVLDFFLYHSAVKIYEKIEQSRRKRRHVIHVDPSDRPYHPKSVRFSDHKLGDIAEEAEEVPREKKFKNPLNFNL